MYKKTIFPLLFIFFFFSACGSPPPPPLVTLTSQEKVTVVMTNTPTATRTLLPSATLTRTPVPTYTPRPIKTPTPNPLSLPTQPVATPFAFTGTAFPRPVQVISPANAANLVQLAQWGYGRITDIAYSSDGKHLFIKTPIGEYVFETTNLEEPVENLMSSDETNTFFKDSFQALTLTTEEIQARYDLDIPKSLFPSNGFPELGCDEQAPFMPHLRDAETIQAQTSPSNQNFFVTYRYADEWLPRLLSLYRVEDGSLLYSIEEDRGIIKATYAPDGNYLALAEEGGAIKILNVITGKEKESSQIFQYFAAENVSFSTEKDQLLIEYKGQLNFYSLPYGIFEGFINIRSLNANVLLPGTGFLLVGDLKGQILFLDPITGNLMQKYIAHTNEITSLAVSSDGQVLASAGADCDIKLWDAKGNEISAPENLVLPGETVENTREKIYGLLFSPNGQYLIGQNYDHQVAIWQTNSGKLIYHFQQESPFLGPTRVYDVSPDGTTLALGSFDPKIEFFSIETLQTIQTIPVPSADDFVSQIKFSHNGQLLIATTTSGWIYIWNVSDQALLFAKQGNAESIYGLTLSSDGTLMATISIDGMISIWGISP